MRHRWLLTPGVEYEAALRVPVLNLDDHAELQNHTCGAAELLRAILKVAAWCEVALADQLLHLAQRLVALLG